MDKNVQNEDRFNEKEYYRNEIIKMVKLIDKTDVLRYIYIIILDIVKEKEK